MKGRRWPVLLGVLLMLTASGRAGTALSVRLVEASNVGGGASKGVDDILPVLKGSLPFADYRVLSACSMGLPATGETGRLGDYEVICRGAQQSLSITITRGAAVMLTTQVKLLDRIPLILGGFPGGRGKHVLVFVAR